MQREQELYPGGSSAHPQDEEITESYTVHFRDSDRDARLYHTLKNFMFECECEACKKNWPMEGEVREERPNTIHEIPDELHAIPSMSQEKVYKVCFGDKKECVRKIFAERKVVEKLMTQKKFADALEAYQDLCETLEKHVRRPHDYYLQVQEQKLRICTKKTNNFHKDYTSCIAN